MHALQVVVSRDTRTARSGCDGTSWSGGRRLACRAAARAVLSSLAWLLASLECLAAIPSPEPAVPAVPPSAPGVQRQHGTRDDKHDSPILLDVQPRILRALTASGEQALKITFWTRTPDEQIRAQLGVVNHVNQGGTVWPYIANSDVTRGTCNRTFPRPGVNSCEILLDVALASTSDEPVFIRIANAGLGSYYEARVQVIAGNKQPLARGGQDTRQANAPGSQNRGPVVARSAETAPGRSVGAAMVGRAAESNTNRAGGDYANSETANAQQCQAACDAAAPCRAWTWVKPAAPAPVAAGRLERHAIATKGKCWLKSSVPVASPNACCTSGVK